MNNIINRMMIGTSLIGITFSLGLGNAYAQTCEAIPSCAELGYTVSESEYCCNLGYCLHCPFDRTKILPIPAVYNKETGEMQPSGGGETEFVYSSFFKSDSCDGSKNVCQYCSGNGKWRTVGCKNGYTMNAEGACEPTVCTTPTDPHFLPAIPLTLTTNRTVTEAELNEDPYLYRTDYACTKYTSCLSGNTTYYACIECGGRDGIWVPIYYNVDKVNSYYWENMEVYSNNYNIKKDGCVRRSFLNENQCQTENGWKTEKNYNTELEWTECTSTDYYHDWDTGEYEYYSTTYYRPSKCRTGYTLNLRTVVCEKNQ